MASTFRLLDLPPELRLRIYESYFQTQRCRCTLDFNSTKITMRTNAPTRTPGRNLLYVCRLIYEEAVPVFLANTTFIMHTGDTDGPGLDGSLNDPSSILDLRFPNWKYMKTISICIQGEGWTPSEVAGIDHQPRLAMVSALLTRLNNCAGITRLILNIDVALDVTTEEYIEVFRVMERGPGQDVDTVLVDDDGYNYPYNIDDYMTYIPLVELLDANVYPLQSTLYSILTASNSSCTVADDWNTLEDEHTL
jgi:hypothetical protein